MTTVTERQGVTPLAERHTGPSLRGRFQDWLPRLVLAPSFLLVLVFVYGFNLWTFFSVVHEVKGVPDHQFDRLHQLSEALELDL